MGGTLLNEIMAATSSSLHKAGKRIESQVILKLWSHQRKAAKLKKRLSLEVQLPRKYTPGDSLALYIDGGYKKHLYKLTQTDAKERKAYINPSYAVLLSAKQNATKMACWFHQCCLTKLG